MARFPVLIVPPGNVSHLSFVSRSFSHSTSILLILFSVFLSSICWGQGNHCFGGMGQQQIACTNYNVGNASGGNMPALSSTTNFANAQTTNVWHLGQTKLAQLSGGGGVADEGLIGGIDSAGHAWFYSFPSETWTENSSMGTISKLAIAGPSLVYSLQPNASCPAALGYNRYYVYKWTGTPTGSGSWTLTGFGCVFDFAATGDGSGEVIETFLTSSNNIGIQYSNGNGQWYGAPFSGGWHWIAIGNYQQAVGVDAVNQDVYLLNLSNQTLTELPGVTSTSPPAMDLAGNVWVVGTDTFIYRYANGSWSRLQGSGMTYVATAGPSLTLAIGPTTSNYNTYIFPPVAVTAAASVTGTTNCGGTCPQGVTHTPQVTMHWEVGSAGGQTVTGNAVCPSCNVSATAQDTTWDPLGCSDAGGFCFTTTTQGSVTCTEAGLIFATAVDEGVMGSANPLTCFLNLVPRRPIGWSSGGSVLVYIDSNYYPSNSVGYAGVVQGIQSWSVANGITYQFSSSNGVPSPEPKQRYIFVTQGAGNRGSSDPCGPPPYRNIPSSCPKAGKNLFRAWLQLANDLTTQAQYAGESVHEEGHDNFMGDCYHCQNGGSIMGSQPTNASNQPDAPTPCDLAWYAAWYLF